MRRRPKKAHAQPVREKSDTAQWAVVGMGAAIVVGVFYLLLRNDPGVPPPVGSQVPNKPPPPLSPGATLTTQTTFSATASNGASFVLKVGDTIAFRPPTTGGTWGRANITSSGGLIQAASISDFGVQPDGTYVFRMDSPGQSMVNLGYMTTSGTNNISMNLTVTP